jgi:RHS repeat-associated protein
MLTAAKQEKFSAPTVWTDECVLSLAAARVYPKTRVWGSKPESVQCSNANTPLTIELRWGCEKSSSKNAAGSGDTFKYDPLGRRIEKSSSAATSIFAYDGDNLIEETNSSGAVVARYTQTQNIDGPLAMLRGSATSYYNADGLGSVTSLTNSSGAAAETYTYDSFGKVTASSGSLVNPFQYTGREFDSETGLYYYRARYYDPSVGRFISEDPIAFNGGFNFYRYVSNSPANFVDPFGEQIGFVGDTLATQTALLYLESSPAANTIIQDLEKSPILYTIDASNGHLIDVTDPYRKRTVFWKPDQALCVKNGVQSPAIQLLHELTHLWQAQNNKSFNEENAVQITNPAAQQLGEPTRINYADAQGNPIWILPIPNR